MPGIGPPPKPAGKRARANREIVPTTVVEFVEFAQPDLDPAVFEWPAHTVTWWESWGRSPMAPLFGESDWRFLADTALIHALAYESARNAAATGSKVDVSLFSELRLRVAKFGATMEDRARLRIVFADADVRETKAARGRTPAQQWRELTAMPQGPASKAS